MHKYIYAHHYYFIIIGSSATVLLSEQYVYVQYIAWYELQLAIATILLLFEELQQRTPHYLNLMFYLIIMKVSAAQWVGSVTYIR